MSTPQRPSYQQRTAYHVTLLGTVALVCSTALVIADQQTREAITAAHQQRLAERIAEVLPIDDPAQAPLDRTVTIELEDGKSLKAWQLINDSRGAADAADATAAAADAAPAEESPTEETPAGESASATGATGTGTDATYAATTGTGTDASDADAADTKTSARVTAVALERIGRGYAGDIGVIVGIDRDGRVIAARVTEHRETPGLGDDIEARRSDWIEMFRGRSLGDPPSQRWTVKRDGGEFDQLTGATISARAVIEAVHEGLALFEEHREALLTPQPDDEDDDEEAIAAD